MISKKGISIASIYLLLICAQLGDQKYLQIITYIAPALVALLLFSINGFSIKFALFSLCLIIFGLIAFAITNEFFPANLLLFILFHAPLILLAARFSITEREYISTLRVLASIIIFQGTIGLYQFFSHNGFGSFAHGAAGDFITGTLGRPASGSSISLTLLISLALCFVWSNRFAFTRSARHLRIVAILFGVIVIVLASNIHQIIASFAGVGLYVIYTSGKSVKNLILKLFGVSVFVASSAALFHVTQPVNVIYATTLVERTMNLFEGLDDPTIPRKIIGLYNALIELPSENLGAVFFGVGPGHFSSRAALFASGEYSDITPPPLSGSTSFTTDHILPLWNKTLLSQSFQDGNANMPFSSFQSLVTELGWPLTLFIILYSFLFLRKQELSNPNLASGGVLGFFVLFFCCLFDNYLEFSKPITVFVLMISLGKSVTFQKRKQAAIQDNATSADSQSIQNTISIR